MHTPPMTVTFLFTDIEGSTKLWQDYPDHMRSALARHDALLRRVITGCGGYVFKTAGMPSAPPSPQPQTRSRAHCPLRQLSLRSRGSCPHR